MSSRTLTVISVSVVLGVLVGALARFTQRGEGWLLAVLGLSAVVVALAQQTLP